MHNTRAPTGRTCHIDVETATGFSGENHITCLVLRDVSSMETDASKPEVFSFGGCADDINVIDTIETCYGVRPILLSKRFLRRRPKTSGIYLDVIWYDFILVFIVFISHVFVRCYVAVCDVCANDDFFISSITQKCE